MDRINQTRVGEEEGGSLSTRAVDYNFISARRNSRAMQHKEWPVEMSNVIFFQCLQQLVSSGDRSGTGNSCYYAIACLEPARIPPLYSYR